MAETKTGREEQSLSRQGERRGVQRWDPSARGYLNPFDLVDRMSEEMDRVFERFFGTPWGWSRPLSRLRAPWRSQERGFWAPRIEAFQKGDRFIVRAELPGLKKDDVQVELTDDALTIHGERKHEQEEEREGYYHSEREYGEFHRVIPLPEGVIGESAEASFRNGVLEITMQAPPAEASRGRRLEIKEESKK